MTALSIQPTFPTFTDSDGTALENGFIWIGVAGSEPISTPLTAYWDAALTQVVTQPVRTRGGYPLNGSAIGRLYVNSNYSIKVRNRNGFDLYSSLTATERYSEVVVNTNASQVVYDPSGAGAVATTVQAKLRTHIDAADYIATPGASNALDQAGVQAAINYVNSIGGGIVRVRPPISTSWNIQSLTVPVGVMIEDLRNISTNNIFLYGVGGDTEYALSGTSVTGGEGPSFVGVNNATSGDRTVSLVARYGNTSTGASVNCYMHMGVWDGANWFPEFDQITNGASGFRSNWRVGYGTAQLNAGITGAAAYTANQILIVNRPFGMGAGGMAFEVDNTVSKFNTEVKIQVANAPLRFCAADGTPNWTFLDQYPSAGQFTLYDHNTSTNKIVFTSAGDTVLLGVLKPSTDNTVSIGTAANRWSVVYAGTGTINTSDEREKQDIADLDAAEKRVAVALKGLVKKFRFKDAVQAKGDAARIHIGVIAQEVIAAFEVEGLDASRYAIICYDEWNAEFDDNGNEIRPAGNRYGIRYDELLAFIISAL